MRFRQRHFSDSVEVDLHDEEFDYTIKSSDGKKRFSVNYMQFDPAVMEEIEQSNTWWRNVGIAWIVIGSVLTWISYARGGDFRISFWLWLGIICLAIFRFGRTSFTHHAIDGGGRLALIKDQKASSILGELTSRRRARLAEVYGEIDFEEDPGSEIAKFKWLESQGALSSDETAAKISAIRAAGESSPEEPIPDVN